MRILASSAIALLVVSAPVVAQDSQPAADDTAATGQDAAVEGEKEDPDLDKVVCRSEKILGSRLGSTKRCQTRRQWEAERAADRRDIERVQNTRYKAGQ